jgi:hypothetical protein
MVSGPEENPLKLPRDEIKSPEEAKHKASVLVDRGGKAINTADPETSTFMIKDQSNPETLNKQEPPKQTSRN